MPTPKQKKGNFIQYEIQNGSAVHVGGSGTKYANYSTAILKPNKGKVATFERHSHPGHEVIGVIYGEIKLIELNKILVAGEIVHIPYSRKLKRGIDHTVDVFEESYIWIVTFNPPDTDFPIENGTNGLDVMNRIMSIALPLIGV